MTDREPPMHPVLVAVAVVVGIAFVVWALAPFVAELIGGYR